MEIRYKVIEERGIIVAGFGGVGFQVVDCFEGRPRGPLHIVRNEADRLARRLNAEHNAKCQDLEQST